MTKDQNFKRRVRRRMAKTGQRYTAARAAVSTAGPDGSATAPAGSARIWVSPPELGDDALRARTGDGWDGWCDRIDAWIAERDGGPATRDDHPRVVEHLLATYEVDHWWAQTITVGWERITGVRLRYQNADGTFTAGKSKTVGVAAGELRAMLVDDADRADLFGGRDTVLVSKPQAKTLRVEIGPGVALISAQDLGDGRTKVTVAHQRLAAYDDVAEWKFFWSEWLDAL